MSGEECVSEYVYVCMYLCACIDKSLGNKTPVRGGLKIGTFYNNSLMYTILLGFLNLFYYQ